ncbi:MAG TPA: hypothetical protein VI548_10945 [Chitinophagaceae bacterium]|nr:hypothetical protein [Chitinophagaceae bacterium]
MKQVKILFLFITAFTLSTHAQTVDEIINKHIEAIGGKEKLLELKTVVSEGNFIFQGMDIPVTIYQSHNQGARVEINVMGMTGYIINTLTEGWTFMPFQGMASPEAMAADQVKEAIDQLDLQGPLLNYTEKGHTVEYLGKEDFEGTECFKLKAVLKGGSELTMFIDPANYYIIKQIVKSKAAGQETEQVQTFSNFQKTAEGLVFAFDQTGFGPGEISFSKIEINKPVEESKYKTSK